MKKELLAQFGFQLTAEDNAPKACNQLSHSQLGQDAHGLKKEIRKFILVAWSSYINVYHELTMGISICAANAQRCLKLVQMSFSDLYHTHMHKCHTVNKQGEMVFMRPQVYYVHIYILIRKMRQRSLHHKIHAWLHAHLSMYALTSHRHLSRSSSHLSQIFLLLWMAVSMWVVSISLHRQEGKKHLMCYTDRSTLALKFLSVIVVVSARFNELHQRCQNDSPKRNKRQCVCVCVCV